MIDKRFQKMVNFVYTTNKLTFGLQIISWVSLKVGGNFEKLQIKKILVYLNHYS